MKRFSRLALLVSLAVVATGLPAQAQESVFGPEDATEVYYWVSNKANLPLFVQYDYVGMEKIANELGVQVRVAGPTDFDLPGLHRRRGPGLRAEACRRLRRGRLGPVADRVCQEVHRGRRADRRGRRGPA